MARDIYEDHDELDAEPPKSGLGNGIVIFTTVLLLVAFFAIQTALKEHFNQGMLADKQAAGTE